MEILAQLRAKAAQLQRARARELSLIAERDALIAQAVAAGVKRTAIAEAAGVKEISVYKIAQAQREGK